MSKLTAAKAKLNTMLVSPVFALTVVPASMFALTFALIRHQAPLEMLEQDYSQRQQAVVQLQDMQQRQHQAFANVLATPGLNKPAQDVVGQCEAVATNPKITLQATAKGGIMRGHEVLPQPFFNCLSENTALLKATPTVQQQRAQDNEYGVIIGSVMSLLVSGGFLLAGRQSRAEQRKRQHNSPTVG